MQSGLPEIGEARQECQPGAVAVGEFRPLDGAFEDDQLLPEHGVLDKEVGFGAR